MIALLPLSGFTQSDSTSTRVTVEAGEVKEYNEAYYILNTLNVGLTYSDSIPNLQTPQAATEYFILACRDKKFDEAAYVLNMNLIPAREQAAIGPELAEKLFYVINNEINIDWDELPDRPDGQLNIPTTSAEKLIGKPRRSLSLGALNLEDWDVAVRLQRVKVAGSQPIWVFSANTVENIDPLYQVYGPSPLAKILPDWADFSITNMPVWKWTVFIVLLLICYFIGRLIRKLTIHICRRSDKMWIYRIAEDIATPIAALLSILLFFTIANSSQAYIGPISSYFDGIMWVSLIAAITWLLMRTIRYSSNYFAERHSDSDSAEGKERNRSYLTYISVAHRALVFLVFIIGVAVILTQFRPMKALGISLLTSVGVLSVVFGIAAQSTLGNILAGVQIAITRPVRIGDAVLYEDNWGWIEDITFTYLIVRTWDQRRMIIPLKHFISHPLENWTMKNPEITRSIYLYADYRIDVQKVREKYQELLKSSEEWDQKVPPVVQVTAVKEETLEIRALCSAKDPSTSWDLHCKLREEMMKYIGELEDGKHLSKRRIKVQNEHALEEQTAAYQRVALNESSN